MRFVKSEFQASDTKGSVTNSGDFCIRNLDLDLSEWVAV